MPVTHITTTARPLTTPVSDVPLPCNRTAPPSNASAARASLAQQVEQVARALQAARGTALRERWSLDDCDVSAGRGPRDAALAQKRYEYVKTLIPARPSRWVSPPPLIRNPWRACANGSTINPEVAARAQLSQRALPRRLWLPEAGQYFPVNVKIIPANCIARVVSSDAAGGGEPLTLRPGPAGWRPLGAAEAGPEIGALYRRLAVVPDLPAEPAEIRAGSIRYRGAGDVWHRYPIAGGVTETTVHSAAEVLDSVDDTQLLQTASDRVDLPLRDADGRFWLPVETARMPAIEVADPREERCLDAVFVADRRTPHKLGWKQHHPVLPTARAANATADAAAADALAAGVGPERGRGMGAIDTMLLGGGRRAHLQPAARLAERWLTTALIRLMGGAPGRASLAPFLDEWPAHLQERALERITDVVTDVMAEVQAFNERNGAEIRLVDTIEGNAWFAARDGAIYVTSAVLDQPVERVARMLIETLIGKMDRGNALFPSLPDDTATLRRAGRLATYDPTIMQEALAWPERGLVANRLAQHYRTPADIAHPLMALATPRSESFGSIDDTDNLSLLLRDGETVMAFIGALQSDAVRPSVPRP